MFGADILEHFALLEGVGYDLMCVLRWRKQNLKGQ